MRGERAGRRSAREVARLVVREVEQLTPSMRRVVFSGPGVTTLAVAPRALGPYIKLLVPAGHGQDEVMRTYSVRRFDPAAASLTVDFVLHGDDGPGSRWAGGARLGDRLGLAGSGSLIAEADVDWFVLAGDQTALPAIGHILETLPPEAQGHAFIAVPDHSACQPLTHPGIAVSWLVGDGGDDLVEAVRAAPWPARRHGLVWAGAEAWTARAIRIHARGRLGLAPSRCPVLAYWRRGRSEGTFSYLA